MRKALPHKRIFLFSLVMMLIIALARCNKPLSFNQELGVDSVSVTSSQKKVLLISIQGAQGAAVEAANIPNIQSLLPNSIYSWDAVCDTITTDQAGWATLFTGVKTDKNGITGGSYTQNNFSTYPAFPALLKNQNPGLRIVSVNGSASLNDTLLPKNDLDVSVNLNNDAAVADSAINRLQNGNPDVMMVTFSGVNDAGEKYGFSDTSAGYLNSIHIVDSYIGQILNALRSRKTYGSENWLVIITSNHGGSADGEYGSSLAEDRNTFVIYYNPSFASSEIKRPLVNVPYDGTFAFFERVNGLDHAAYTNNPIYNFGANQNFTIEFNINTTYSGGDDHPVIGNKNWQSGSNIGWVIYKQNGNIRINYTGADSSRIDMRNGPYVADGKWHHITVTFDRQNDISIYMDGQFFVSGPSIQGDGSLDSGLPLAVGTDGTLNYGNASGNNYISDIRIWKTVLPAKVINDWAFIPVTTQHPDYSSLIGYWPAINGNNSDQTIKDYSPSHMDLTIENGLQWDEIDGVLNPSNINPILFIPKSIDVATDILAWMGVKIQPAWQLDGQVWILE